MRIEARRSRFQAKPNSAMITGPGLPRIEQSFSYPAGATVGRDGKVLDPSALPEAHGHDVQIDRRKPNDYVVVIRHQDGCPIVRHGRTQTISGSGG